MIDMWKKNSLAQLVELSLAIAEVQSLNPFRFICIEVFENIPNRKSALLNGND